MNTLDEVIWRLILAAPKQEVTEVHVVDVQRHKGALMVPEDLAFKDAAEILMQKAKYDEELVSISEDINVFVWDGALALSKALVIEYGFAMQQKTWTFFGPKPPAQVSIEVGPGVTQSVPWGRFVLPGIEGWISTGVSHGNDGRILFQVTAEVKQKDKDKVHKLVRLVRKIATEQSVYKGKAFELQLRDSEGERLSLPKPKFMLLSDDEVIFNRELEERILDNILVPIQYSQLVREDGTKLKRGTLLAGPYGTGKTLTAQWIARIAIAYGWTFIYVKNIDELSEVLTFAQGLFQPVVVFGEDADQIAGPNRTHDVNRLLETLDGIGTKGDEIFTILTTNFPERINLAMRRPGRIDLILKVEPPDEEAVRRLIRHYGGKRINFDEDLTEVSRILAGKNPAIIREVVERSKLTVIRRTGSNKKPITQADLIPAANTIISEQEHFGEVKHMPTKAEKLGRATEDLMRAAVKEYMVEMDD